MRNEVHLWINDELIDLPIDTVIRQTFKAFDIAAFNTTWRNFTNTFTAPFTENNDRILGNARTVQSDTSKPYAANSARLVQNGVEIINNGVVVIKGVSESGYSIFILSGISFFDVIGSKGLVDLDFTGGINSSILDVSIATMNTTTERITPVMNYGRFDTTTYAPEYSMMEENILPSFYYHTLINKIFSDAGYQKSGTIFSDSKYLKTIVPYGREKWAYGGDFGDKRTSIYDKTSSQDITYVNLSTTDITFTDEVYQGLLGFYDGTSLYTPIEADATAGYRLFYVTVQLTIDITVTGGTVDLKLNNAATAGPFQTGVGTGSYVSEITDYGRNGVALSIRAAGSTGTPAITVNSARVSFIAQDTPFIGTSSYAYLNLLLPEISQRNFLKDFSLRFGQCFMEKNGTVYCKSIDEIISNTANAIDWTSKRVKGHDDIDYTPSELGRKNYFKYSNSDFEVSKAFAEASIDIANENLKTEHTLTSSFGASQTKLNGNIYMANVNIYDPTLSGFLYDAAYAPGIRVLLVRDRYSYEASVRPRADISATTSYKVAYFADPIQPFSCKWQDTINRYYKLYTQSLQKYKLIKRKYILTEADIQNLDFFLPVFDGDSYYVINTVSNYIPGKVTQVEMLKI